MRVSDEALLQEIRFCFNPNNPMSFFLVHKAHFVLSSSSPPCHTRLLFPCNGLMPLAKGIWLLFTIQSYSDNFGLTLVDVSLVQACTAMDGLVRPCPFLLSSSLFIILNSSCLSLLIYCSHLNNPNSTTLNSGILYSPTSWPHLYTK